MPYTTHVWSFRCVPNLFTDIDALYLFLCISVCVCVCAYAYVYQLIDSTLSHWSFFWLPYNPRVPQIDNLTNNDKERESCVCIFHSVLPVCFTCKNTFTNNSWMCVNWNNSNHHHVCHQHEYRIGAQIHIIYPRNRPVVLWGHFYQHWLILIAAWTSYFTPHLTGHVIIHLYSS